MPEKKHCTSCGYVEAPIGEKCAKCGKEVCFTVTPSPQQKTIMDAIGEERAKQTRASLAILKDTIEYALGCYHNDALGETQQHAEKYIAIATTKAEAVEAIRDGGDGAVADIIEALPIESTHDHLMYIKGYINGLEHAQGRVFDEIDAFTPE
jgi:hypothetical protein